MASPLVAGVVGLMLNIDPELTAAQIGGILRRTAQPLAGSDYEWRKDAGFGVMNPEAAIAETKWYSELPQP
jgi:subtilisin family serine protease